MTSGLSILLHGVISLPNTTSYDELHFKIFDVKDRYTDGEMGRHTEKIDRQRESGILKIILFVNKTADQTEFLTTWLIWFKLECHLNQLAHVLQRESL